jgi:hypothetical protein
VTGAGWLDGDLDAVVIRRGWRRRPVVYFAADSVVAVLLELDDAQRRDRFARRVDLRALADSIADRARTALAADEKGR